MFESSSSRFFFGSVGSGWVEVMKEKSSFSAMPSGKRQKVPHGPIIVLMLCIRASNMSSTLKNAPERAESEIFVADKPISQGFASEEVGTHFAKRRRKGLTAEGEKDFEEPQRRGRKHGKKGMTVINDEWQTAKKVLKSNATTAEYLTFGFIHCRVGRRFHT